MKKLSIVVLILLITATQTVLNAQQEACANLVTVSDKPNETPGQNGSTATWVSLCPIAGHYNVMWNGRMTVGPTVKRNSGSCSFECAHADHWNGMSVGQIMKYSGKPNKVAKKVRGVWKLLPNVSGPFQPNIRPPVNPGPFKPNVNNQLSLAKPMKNGKVNKAVHETSPGVRQWDVWWGNGTSKRAVATAFTLEKGGNASLDFGSIPTPVKGVMFACTYTSPSSKIAGWAYDENTCANVGDSTDQFTTKANAWFGVYNGAPTLDKTPHCGDVQVYQVLDKGVLNMSLLNSLTGTKTSWRLGVLKESTHTYDNGTVKKTTDFLVLDFGTGTTIQEASKMAKTLERNQRYNSHKKHLKTEISAFVMDTGSYLPYSKNGRWLRGGRVVMTNSLWMF